MSRIINLKWAATCKDCGTDLPVGTEARYYGRGKVFGVHCHDKDGNCTPWGAAGPGQTTAEDWNGSSGPALDGDAQTERDRIEADAAEYGDHGPAAPVEGGALAGITGGRT